jgi:adenine deaminase
MMKKELAAASGEVKAELVLKNAGIINVFTESVQYADIAICNGRIAGIGTYSGEAELDCTGKYAAPGFIDGHIHLESSMLRPAEFAKAVLPHGTTAVITDPHEIANVCGMDGIRFMLEASEGLPLDIYFMLPSCVPSTQFDENGAKLTADELEPLYDRDKVLGLAEVMDYYGTIRGDAEVLAKISSAKQHCKLVDGHAPGLRGREACAYILAGIRSDHECTSLEEAREKLSLGQWIMIREGTAAKNLEALIDLFKPPYHQRAMLVTDDRHPHDILTHGHMDDILRRAIQLGADPCIAIKMATYHTASYFGLQETGAIAPGYRADIVILSDLKEMTVEKVLKNGRLIADRGLNVMIEEPYVNEELQKKVRNSFHMGRTKAEDFRIREEAIAANAACFRVIGLVAGDIRTEELKLPLTGRIPCISTERDILKLAVVERHHATGHIGLGFVHGYGLKRGAIASSVSHDSHNIVVIGTNELDMAAAVNCIRDMQGGWAIALEGELLGSLPLPIGGLISDLDAVTLSDKIAELKSIARELGVLEGVDPFMTPAFVCLPVIPELRLITTGLFDVGQQQVVPIVI